jgi:TonB family protein
MEAFAAYLMKSAIWLTGFAIVYFLFLRNERYFMLKRIYLVSGILISLIFPLISFHYQVEMPAPAISQADLSGASSSAIAVQLHAVAGKPFNYRLILLFLYLSGMIFLLFRAIRHFSSIFKTINKANINRQGPVKLIRASQFPASFSFFNYVFINPSVSENEAEEIMNHEIVHVRQKHWFDLLLVEILRLIQWINPFAWIYTRFIRLNHEYLADQVALQRTASPANYRAALMNQLFESPVISFSNSFNYSLNKKRFDMMKKIITSPYRKLKVLLVLPVFAIVFYAFATPEYVYAESRKTLPEIKSSTPVQPILAIQQDTVKAKTVKEPLKSPVLPPPPAQAKGKKESEIINAQVTQQEKPKLAVFVDGVYTDKSISQINKELGHNWGILKPLSPKDGLEKYGEQGKNGGCDILTRGKALEMGLKPSYPRISPEDYPTFKGQGHASFNDWLLGQLKYPEDAISTGTAGTVRASYSIATNGTICKLWLFPSSDKTLGDAVIKVMASSPRWEPPKNPESIDTFKAFVSLKFELPDKISIPEEPFIVVDEMPVFSEGDVALLNFIKENTQYPLSAKTNLKTGRVIVRFVVNKEGKVEQASVLKGVDPSLDAEALRVVNSLPAFIPGKQGGKPVPVYYMVPVTFSLTKDTVKTNP